MPRKKNIRQTKKEKVRFSIDFPYSFNSSKSTNVFRNSILKVFAHRQIYVGENMLEQSLMKEAQSFRLWF